MKKIQELYAIEDQAKQANLSVDQRKELRLPKSLQVLNELGKQIARSTRQLSQEPDGHSA
ncbi:MAG: hypothetical protein U5K51_14325 [Flavobacteriaceae bacterium]|nr:hypothetical protein [Flavobacteriaceae bacterium]